MPSCVAVANRHAGRFAIGPQVDNLPHYHRQSGLVVIAGHDGFPLPPEGLASYIAELRAQGFTQRELDRMMKENPARLLGLPVL